MAQLAPRVASVSEAAGQRRVLEAAGTWKKKERNAESSKCKTLWRCDPRLYEDSILGIGGKLELEGVVSKGAGKPRTLELGGLRKSLEV